MEAPFIHTHFLKLRYSTLFMLNQEDLMFRSMIHEKRQACCVLWNRATSLVVGMDQSIQSATSRTQGTSQVERACSFLGASFIFLPSPLLSGGVQVASQKSLWELVASLKHRHQSCRGLLHRLCLLQKQLFLDRKFEHEDTKSRVRNMLIYSLGHYSGKRKLQITFA